MIRRRQNLLVESSLGIWKLQNRHKVMNKDMYKISNKSNGCLSPEQVFVVDTEAHIGLYKI